VINQREGGITVYEFDAFTRRRSSTDAHEDLHVLPAAIYDWLEAQSLNLSDAGDAAWLRLGQRGGRRVVQVTSYAGVIPSVDTSNPATDRHRKTGHQTGALRLG
jgi:5-methylcytosine-specific restriction enzyme subunit McrC